MAQPPTAAEYERVRPRVLVVDDVDATRDGLAGLLRILGYETCTASDGAEALKVLQGDPHIRAVVLDLLMPRTNGYWFREQQLRDPSIASVPVIVFTGAGKREEIMEALKVSEVLSKPLSVDRLLEAIGRCCHP